MIHEEDHYPEFPFPILFWFPRTMLSPPLSLYFTHTSSTRLSKSHLLPTPTPNPLRMNSPHKSF